MELQRGENNHDCFLTAAAMVMDVPVSKLKERIGHNGNEVVFPSIEEPYCFKGFHNQEIIDLAFLEGWSVMDIEAGPGLAPFKGNDPPYYLDMPKQRMQVYLNKFIGIIGGVGESTHAVAWDKKMVFDPSGSVYKLQDFKLNIREFWAFSKYVV